MRVGDCKRHWNGSTPLVWGQPVSQRGAYFCGSCHAVRAFLGGVKRLHPAHCCVKGEELPTQHFDKSTINFSLDTRSCLQHQWVFFFIPPLSFWPFCFHLSLWTSFWTCSPDELVCTYHFFLMNVVPIPLKKRVSWCLLNLRDLTFHCILCDQVVKVSRLIHSVSYLIHSFWGNLICGAGGGCVLCMYTPHAVDQNMKKKI